MTGSLPTARPIRPPRVAATFARGVDDDDDDLTPGNPQDDISDLRLPRDRDLRARLRFRHWLVILSFFACVVAPTGAILWYLYERAADQFISTAGFSIRSDDTPTEVDFFSDLMGTSMASGSTNADIVFDYLISQEIVEKVDARVDLRTLWRREAAGDPWLSLKDRAEIDSLLSYWRSMLDVTYEPKKGIIGLHVRAFRPEDAQAIAAATLREAEILVNRLADEAKAAAVRQADADLGDARARLEGLRREFLAFRTRNRLITPAIEAELQFAVVAALQARLSQEVVARAELVGTTRDQDPRFSRADRRILAISAQLATERARIGSTDPAARKLTELLARYEDMEVDLRFAGEAYVAAAAQRLAAEAEARRNTIYLATHLAPSRPETATFPQRGLLSGLAGFLLLIAWGSTVLILYNIRDQS